MTEQPRAAVTEDLDGLQTALASAIPARTASNLLVGTWNIRALGDLTGKWLAGPKDSPKRDWHAIACLGAVISRFDVVAVQESRRNPAALRRRLASLGPGWRVIISDVTEGAAGLVGEIVLPPIGGEPAAAVRPHPVHGQLHPGRPRHHSRVRPHPRGQQPGRAAAGDHRVRRMDARLGGPAQRLELEPHRAR